jgi:small-conductance mechanosensitive channel
MEILQQMLSSVADVLLVLSVPLKMLVISLVLVLAGWIIARLLQWVIVYVLKAVMLDKGCQTIGLTPILTKGEIKKAPSDIIADLGYWLVMILTVVAAADFLGLRSAMTLLRGVLNYMTNVAAASIVLALAIILAVVASGLVLLVANNLGIAYSKTIARIVKYALIIFGSVVALEFLGIPASYIMKESSLVVGMVALGAAIAFGLGCKDIAGDFITNIFKQR